MSPATKGGMSGVSWESQVDFLRAPPLRCVEGGTAAQRQWEQGGQPLISSGLPHRNCHSLSPRAVDKFCQRCTFSESCGMVVVVSLKGMSLRNGLGTAERCQGGNRARALRHDRCRVGAAPGAWGFCRKHSCSFLFTPLAWPELNVGECDVIPSSTGLKWSCFH